MQDLFLWLWEKNSGGLNRAFPFITLLKSFQQTAAISRQRGLKYFNLSKNTDKMAKSKSDKLVTCMLVGDCNTGKSMLCLAFSSQSFPVYKKYTPTIFDNFCGMCLYGLFTKHHFISLKPYLPLPE